MKLVSCLLVTYVFLLIPLLLPVSGHAQTLDGTWLVDRERSVDFDPWRRLEVKLSFTDETATIDRFWRANSRYTQSDSITVPVGRSVRIPVRPGKWMDQVYLAVFVPDDARRSVTATLTEDRRSLTVVTDVPLESAQQDLTVKIISTYSLSDDGSEMTLVETRSTRAGGAPLKYVFVRQ